MVAIVAVQYQICKIIVKAFRGGSAPGHWMHRRALMQAETLGDWPGLGP